MYTTSDASDAAPDSVVSDPSDTTDALDSSEALTPDVPEPADAEDSDGDDPAGPPRDGRGRFRHAQEPADAEDSDPTDPDDDALTGEPAQGQDPAAATPADGNLAPEPTTEPDPVPFAFRVRGQDVPLEGATIKHGTLHVPETALPRVQQLLALGRDYEVTGRQQMAAMRQELEATRTQVHEDTVRGQSIATFFDDLLSQGPDAVAQWLDSYVQNAPVLQAARRQAAEARAAHLEQQYQHSRRGAMPPPQDEPPHQGDPASGAAGLRDEAVHVVAETVREAREQLAACKGLTDQDVEAIVGDLGRWHLDHLFRYPTEDEVITHGVDPRLPVLDPDVFQQLVQQKATAILAPREVERRVKAEAAAAARQRQAAARANAARVQNTQPNGLSRPSKAPPSTAPAVSGAAATTNGTITRDEWQRLKGA